MIALLLENKADVNARNDYNQTPCNMVMYEGEKQKDTLFDLLLNFSIIFPDREALRALMKC